MSLSVSLGSGDLFTLNSLADLKSDLHTALKLGQEFTGYLDGPIAGLPAALRSTTLQFGSGNQTWAPGPIQFTLSGGVSGRLSVFTEGDLLCYSGRLPVELEVGPNLVDTTKTQQSIEIRPGGAFIALELDFHIAGGISGSYTSGVYGVTTSTVASADVCVACYCACDPSTPLQAAVAQVFERFVLPLHVDTLTRLTLGDYLHYTFKANLQLGLGASAGFDKVFYAGQYKVDIPRTAGALNLNVAVQPEVQCGAKLAFHCDYAGTFEALLWKEPAYTAHLHLYRSKTQDTSLGLQLGATLTTGSSVSQQLIADHLAQTLTQALPSQMQSGFTANVLRKGSDQVAQFADEINGKIVSWLSRKDGQKCSLDFALEKMNSRFLLTEYTLDLAGNYQPAWKSMIEGRFCEAIETPGSSVTLSAGSGLENAFRTSALIRLNLFGALSAEWTSSILSNSSLVYAGNRTFHLVTQQGRQLLSNIAGTGKEIDIYFAAEADVSDGATTLAEVTLNVVLQATHNPKFGSYVANVVGLLSSGTAGASLAASVADVATQTSGTETLHLVFEPSAYGRLRASTLHKGRPDNEAPDAANYAAFASACGQLFRDPPANFTWAGHALEYGLWRECNIASNDQWPPSGGALPDRTSSAGYNPSAQSRLEQTFPGIGLAGNGVFYTFSAAAQFMDLCDDLFQLANDREISMDTWNDLINRLQKIIRNDVNPYFIAPTTLALAMLCGGAPTLVSGPAPDLPTGTSIGITMSYT